MLLQVVKVLAKNSVEDLISHANSMYWVSMAERGSMMAIHHGLDYLKKAERKLKGGRVRYKKIMVNSKKEFVQK